MLNQSASTVVSRQTADFTASQIIVDCHEQLQLDRNSVALPNIHVTQRRVNVPMIFQGELSKNIVGIYLPCTHQTESFNGMMLASDSVVWALPEKPMYLNVHGPAKAILLCIDLNELAKYVGEQGITALLQQNYRFNSKQLVKPLCVHKMQLVNMAEQLLNHPKFTHPEQMAAFEDAMMLKIQQMIIQEFELSDQISSHNAAYSVVNRALGYVSLSPGRRVGVTQLAHDASCSVRTLEYAFKKTFDMTPVKYLNLLRMHQVRQILQNRQCISITQVLSEFGVLNGGRFSQQYKTLFNEYPKETLNSD